MRGSSRHNLHGSHTIVLKRREVFGVEGKNYGPKQAFFSQARGSPPTIRLPSQIAFPPPPIREGPRRVQYDFFENHRGATLLERFGVDSYLGYMVVRFLVFLMLFQPVYVALGMELESSDGVIAETSVDTEKAEETTPQNSSSSLLEESAGIPVSDIPEISSENTEVSETQANEEVEGVETEEVLDESQETEISEQEGSEEGEFEEQEEIVEEETEGDGTSDTNFENEDDIASSADDSETGNQETASTTEDVASTTPEVGIDEEVLPSEKNENTYVFNEGDCTLVTEGEFYCVANGPERHTDKDPSVYAEKDREGDREIYYFDGVEIHRITNNSYDDFAPVFDEETMRIVWQAMIQDRLQIMLHEITTNTTRQVTVGKQNSSNPHIIRDTIVWQEWVDTNWEIMMTEVSDEGQPFEVERLTDNMVHDMFPVAYDSLITWQSERGSSWEVVVYDLVTGKQQTLEKNEDTKYENPRFVLLFDSKHDNGDVETIGYNLDTGEKMELGTKANPQPLIPVTPKEEVPEALPQSATSTATKITKEDLEPNDQTLE